MGFHSCNGVVLHATRVGAADRPALVFSNSLGTDTRIWDAVVPLLGDRYSLVLYDKRGHGLSDAPRGPYRIADHATDLLALLDALGIGRFALVGLSVGGMIAQAIAIDRPDRVAALVLCDTAAMIGDAATWDARIEAVEHGGLASVAAGVLERWFTPAYRGSQPVAMAGWRNMLTRQPSGGYAATCAAIRDADLRGIAPGIAAPTLVVAGEADLSTPPALVRGMADLIPGSRFVLLSGAGHLPPVEQPEALAALILDHLAGAGWA